MDGENGRRLPARARSGSGRPGNRRGRRVNGRGLIDTNFEELVISIPTVPVYGLRYDDSTEGQSGNCMEVGHVGSAR